jgi:hypothetical protein
LTLIPDMTTLSWCVDTTQSKMLFTTNYILYTALRVGPQILVGSCKQETVPCIPSGK